MRTAYAHARLSLRCRLCDQYHNLMNNWATTWQKCALRSAYSFLVSFMFVFKTAVHHWRFRFVKIIWAAAWQNQQNELCAQWRLRSAWASAQSDQSLRCRHKEPLDPYLPIECTAKTLIRLGGCPTKSPIKHIFARITCLSPSDQAPH